MENEYQPPKANTRTRIRVNRIIHVKKNIAGKGPINVIAGEEVLPQDILGRSSMAAGFSAVNIAELLGVPPSEGMKFLKRPVGKTIFKGELLALKEGMFGQKVVRAPTDSLIESYDTKTGNLRLQFLPKEIAVTAGVFGIIEDINQNTRTVLIKTMVTEVFGIIGSGNERGGILNIIGNQGSFIDISKIQNSLHHHILVTGSLIDSNVLKSAAGFGIAGTICGGISAQIHQSIASNIDPATRMGTDIGFSILATEGYGLIPIGEDIFKKIKEHEGRFVFINGNSNRLLLPTVDRDCILTLRKTVLPIKNTPDVLPELEIGDIGVGTPVRIIWPPFMGAQGVVHSIDKTPSLLESGISTILLTIETGSQKIKTPFANVEIIK